MKKHLDKVYEYLKNNYKTIIFDIVLIGVCLFVCFYNFPYVIYRPGGVLNISNRIEIESGFSQEGTYNMSYVTVARGNIPNLLLSFIMPNWDLKKEEDITIDNTDYETTLAIEKIDMQNSLETAKYVAFNKANLEVFLKNKDGIIVSLDENANTDLQILDHIVSINGQKYTDIENLKSYINTFSTGDKIEFVVTNNDVTKTRYAYVYEYEGRKIVGIVVYDKLEYSTKQELRFKERSSEAGSSGGLMLTLSIFDELIEEDLTKGRTIVGTGTINLNGEVGQIGGIKYKLLGAEKDHADIFFVPPGNYEEALKVYNEFDLSFELVKVETIDDAINYLRK